MASRCFQNLQRGSRRWLSPSTSSSARGQIVANSPVATSLTPQSTPVHQSQQVRCVGTGIRENGTVVEEPPKDVRFGLVKIFLTMFAGLSVGAWMSQKMAAFLEENELFVPEDDDDDDDD